jgi:steroid 5-alpha reductase family enzyme
MGLILATNLAIVIGIMTILWVAGTLRKDVSLVDPFWGFGFVIVVWLTVLRLDQPSARVLLLAVLTTLWGLRLSLFLLWRNRGHGEDKRYAAMRSGHGRRFWWVSFFTVFLLQALILWFVALPIQAAGIRNLASPIGLIDILGSILWTIGFVFETMGDAQLARFKSNPENAGKVLDSGLWGWTRHPNYFGDFCVWWGLYLIATAGGAGWTILSPLAMSFLLMKVSGVTLLEKTIVHRRPDYVDYIARTSAFFPRPPKLRSIDPDKA